MYSTFSDIKGRSALVTYAVLVALTAEEKTNLLSKDLRVLVDEHLKTLGQPLSKNFHLQMLLGRLASAELVSRSDSTPRQYSVTQAQRDVFKAFLDDPATPDAWGRDLAATETYAARKLAEQDLSPATRPHAFVYPGKGRNADWSGEKPYLAAYREQGWRRAYVPAGWELETVGPNGERYRMLADGRVARKNEESGKWRLCKDLGS